MDCPAPNATSSRWARQQTEVRNNSEIRIAKRLTSIVCLLERNKTCKSCCAFLSEKWRRSLSQRDHVDLYRDVFRQPRHFHGRTRRRRSLADLSVDLVHLPEFPHVLEE